MRLAIYAEPVFSYFYKEGAKTSWWQKQEVIDTALLIDLIEVKSHYENEIDNFLTLEIQPFSFPIVRARVIRNGKKDILCINMNHTPTDGAGLKEFVKILASIYTNLITNPEFEPKPEINGDRSLKQVTDHFTFFQKSFEQTDMRNHYATKPVIIPVDLRKYIKKESGYPICSLTGSLTCNIGKVTGASFKDTVMKVRDEMNKKKEVHAEMNRIIQIVVLSRIIPYGKLKEKLMNMRMPPIPLVTNIGIIKQADINFNDVPVEDAFVTGAISFEDYFSMGFSTFQNVITFSIGYSGGDEQEQKVKVFLGTFKAELESIR